MAGVITDSLGRRWDPSKHPRDRKGRFIRTFHKVRLFETGGSKPWGVGTVSDITDEDHIGVDVTALARNNPESANHRVGEHVEAQSSNLESVNEKASLSKPSEGRRDPESKRIGQRILPDPYSGFTSNEIWSEPRDDDSEELKEARRKYFSRFPGAAIALAQSRENVVPENGIVRREYDAEARQKENYDAFIKILEERNIDTEAADPNAPDGLPALQELIDEQNAENPLPNGWKEKLPETLDREFESSDGTVLRGISLTGENDEPDFFESDDDGENWSERDDFDSLDDLFGDETDEPEDDEPKADLTPEPKALPAKPLSEDDFLAALEEFWEDDDTTIIEEGEVHELTPGYRIERPEGSKTSTVYGPDNSEIVKIPETADNERLQDAASKIFDHQNENLPDDEEDPKATLPPTQNAPEEPLPVDPNSQEELRKLTNAELSKEYRELEKSSRPRGSEADKRFRALYGEGYTRGLFRGGITSDPGEPEALTPEEHFEKLSVDAQNLLVNEGDPKREIVRTVALNDDERDALDELEREGLVKAPLEDGDPYELTEDGLDVYNAGKALQGSETPSSSVEERIANLSPEAWSALLSEESMAGGFKAFDEDAKRVAELEEAGFFRKDEKDGLYHLTEDGQEAVEIELAKRAERELEEEREARRIKDAESKVSEDDESVSEDDAIAGLDGFHETTGTGQVPEEIEALEDQGLAEVNRKIYNDEGEYEEWSATLTPEGQQRKTDILRRIGDIHLITPADLTPEEIDAELARLDESDANPDTTPFTKNMNRLRRSLLTKERDKRGGTPTPTTVEEETPESISAEFRNRLEDSMPYGDDGTGPGYNDDDERRSHIDDWAQQVIDSHHDGTLTREDADALLDDLYDRNNDFLDRSTVDEYRDQLDSAPDDSDALPPVDAKSEFKDRATNQLEANIGITPQDVRDKHPNLTDDEAVRVADVADTLHYVIDENDDQYLELNLPDLIGTLGDDYDREESPFSDLRKLIEEAQALFQKPEDPLTRRDQIENELDEIRDAIRTAKPEEREGLQARERELLAERDAIDEANKDEVGDALVAYQNAQTEEERHEAATDVIELIESHIFERIYDDKGNLIEIRDTGEKRYETLEQYIQRYRDTDFEEPLAKWTSDEREFPIINEMLLQPGFNPKDTNLNIYMVDENGQKYRYLQRGRHKGKRIRKGDLVAFKFKTSGRAVVDPETGEEVTREGLWIGRVKRFMYDKNHGGKIKIEYVDTDGQTKDATIDYDNVYDTEGMDTEVTHNKNPEIQAPKGLTRKEEIDHFIDAWFGSDNWKRFSRLDGNEKFFLSDGYYLTARQGGEPPYLALHAPDGRVVNDSIEVPGFQYGTVARDIEGPSGNPVHRFENRQEFIDDLDAAITQDQNNPNAPATVDVPSVPTPEPTPASDGDGSGYVRDLDATVPIPDIMDDDYLPARLWRLGAKKHQDVYAGGPTLPLDDVDTALQANPEYVAGSGNLWTTNCYNAVTAFVMRMQGYDVRADSDDGSIWTLSRLADRWWRPDREGDRWAFPGPTSSSRGAWKKQLEADLKAHYPRGAYGAITIKYKKTLDGGGHVFVWYRDKDTGEIRFLEPQSGTEYKGNEPWGNIAQNFPVVYMRLDDLGLPTGEGVVPNTGTEFQHPDAVVPDTSTDTPEFDGAAYINGVAEEWARTGNMPGELVDEEYSSTPLGIHEYDGSKFIVKQPAYGSVENEIFAAELLTAFGWDYHAAEGPDGNLIATFAEGRTGTEWMGNDTTFDQVGQQRVRDIPRSFELAVLDMLMMSRDRHDGNWMIEDDGTLHPIDHEMSFDTYGFGSPHIDDDLTDMLGPWNNDFIRSWTEDAPPDPRPRIQFRPEWNNKVDQLEDMQRQLEAANFPTMPSEDKDILLDRMEHLIKLVKDQFGGSR